MSNFDFIQGYRFARDTLLSAAVGMLPEVIRNLRAAADKHPEQYAAGIHKLLDEVSTK